MKNRRPFLLWAGAAIGFGLAALACLLLYRMRSEIVCPADLEAATDARLIASVPNGSWWNLEVARRVRRGQAP